MIIEETFRSVGKSLGPRDLPSDLPRSDIGLTL